MTSTHHKIRVEPSGEELACSEDETVIECAWRHGLYWPTICGGAGECAACRCEIVEGMEHAAAPGDIERLMFAMRPAVFAENGAMRLACCLRITGPVTIRKNGVRPR